MCHHLDGTFPIFSPQIILLQYRIPLSVHTISFILICNCLLYTSRKVLIALSDITYEYDCIFEKLVEELQPYDFVVNCRGNLVNLRPTLQHPKRMLQPHEGHSLLFEFLLLSLSHHQNGIRKRNGTPIYRSICSVLGKRVPYRWFPF